MNFYDTIQYMEYYVREKKDNLIVIQKQGELAKLIMIFDTKKKEMTGFLKNTSLLYELDQISQLYTDFRELKKDIEKLRNLSKYTLI